MHLKYICVFVFGGVSKDYGLCTNHVCITWFKKPFLSKCQSRKCERDLHNNGLPFNVDQTNLALQVWPMEALLLYSITGEYIYTQLHVFMHAYTC